MRTYRTRVNSHAVNPCWALLAVGTSASGLLMDIARPVVGCTVQRRQRMRLRLDTSAVSRFIVSRAPAPKTERETGRQRADTQTGELLFSVQVMALDDTGGD